MAIAFDTSLSLTGDPIATSHTFSYTCTGSNRALVVAFSGSASSDNCTGVTYNGVSMTQISKMAPGSGSTGSDRWRYLYLLINPASGSNNIVISYSSAEFVFGGASSYTGVSQTGQPDAQTTGSNASATSFTQSITTVADNCWIIEWVTDEVYNASQGTNTVVRCYTDGTSPVYIADSNGAKTPAGSHSLNLTTATTTNWGALILSLAPATDVANSGFFNFM